MRWESSWRLRCRDRQHPSTVRESLPLSSRVRRPFGRCPSGACSDATLRMADTLQHRHMSSVSSTLMQLNQHIKGITRPYKDALARQNLSCTYLAHHELESALIIITIVGEGEVEKKRQGRLDAG